MLIHYNLENAVCKKFEFTSSGPAKQSQASRLGDYVREDNLTNGRVAYYNREKEEYLYWMNGFWMVRYFVPI